MTECTNHLIYRICIDDNYNTPGSVVNDFSAESDKLVKKYISQVKSKADNLETAYDENLTRKWKNILTKIFSQQDNSIIHVWDLNSPESLKTIHNPSYSAQEEKILPFIYLTASSDGFVVHYNEHERRKFYRAVPIARNLGFQSNYIDGESLYGLKFVINIHIFENFIRKLYSYYVDNGSIYIYQSNERNAFVSGRGNLFISSSLIENMNEKEILILLIHEATHLVYNADSLVKYFSEIYDSQFHKNSFSLGNPIFNEFMKNSKNRYIKDNHNSVDYLSQKYASILFGINLEDYKNFLEKFQDYENSLSIDTQDRLYYLETCGFAKISTVPSDTILYGKGGYVIKKTTVDKIMGAYLQASGTAKECVDLSISKIPSSFPGNSYDYLSEYGKKRGILSIKNLYRDIIK